MSPSPSWFLKRGSSYYQSIRTPYSPYNYNTLEQKSPSLHGPGRRYPNSVSQMNVDLGFRNIHLCDCSTPTSNQFRIESWLMATLDWLSLSSLPRYTPVLYPCHFHFLGSQSLCLQPALAHASGNQYVQIAYSYREMSKFFMEFQCPPVEGRAKKGVPIDTQIVLGPASYKGGQEDNGRKFGRWVCTMYSCCMSSFFFEFAWLEFYFNFSYFSSNKSAALFPQQATGWASTRRIRNGSLFPSQFCGRGPGEELYRGNCFRPLFWLNAIGRARAEPVLSPSLSLKEVHPGSASSGQLSREEP